MSFQSDCEDMSEQSKVSFVVVIHIEDFLSPVILIVIVILILILILMATLTVVLTVNRSCCSIGKLASLCVLGHGILLRFIYSHRTSL